MVKREPSIGEKFALEKGGNVNKLKTCDAPGDKFSGFQGMYKTIWANNILKK